MDEKENDTAICTFCATNRPMADPLTSGETLSTTAWPMSYTFLLTFEAPSCPMPCKCTGGCGCGCMMHKLEQECLESRILQRDDSKGTSGEDRITAGWKRAHSPLFGSYIRTTTMVCNEKRYASREHGAFQAADGQRHSRCVDFLAEAAAPIIWCAIAHALANRRPVCFQTLAEELADSVRVAQEVPHEVNNHSCNNQSCCEKATAAVCAADRGSHLIERALW